MQPWQDCSRKVWLSMESWKKGLAAYNAINHMIDVLPSRGPGRPYLHTYGFGNERMDVGASKRQPSAPRASICPKKTRRPG